LSFSTWWKRDSTSISICKKEKKKIEENTKKKKGRGQNRGREYWVVVARWPSLFARSSPEQSPDKVSFHLPFVLFESSLHLALCEGN